MTVISCSFLNFFGYGKIDRLASYSFLNNC